MIDVKNHIGCISISNSYIYELVYLTVNGCFGVAGLSPISFSQQIQDLLLKNRMKNKGIKIYTKNGLLTINLHIIAANGANIPAVCESVAHKVRYALEYNAGLKADRINIYIDSVKI